MTSSSTFAGSTKEFTGKCVGVTDGDTIKVMKGGRAVKIRLIDIDCPEKRQPWGNQAKQFTAKLAFGKSVTVKYRGKDRYGRILGMVILPGGRNLNHELVKVGLAWRWKYSKDPTLGKLELKARQAKRGMWQGKNPIPPWEWRKGGR